MLSLIASLLITAVPAPASGGTPDCRSQISVGLDDEGGSFNGMSHSGVLLVVRNRGASACRMAGLPALRFMTARGDRLPVERRAPPGMHPGPVILPVVIAAGAEATTALRWTSSDAYAAHNCATPAKLVIGDGETAHAIEWRRRLCGPAGAAIPFDQPPLRLDPTNTGGE